MPMSQSRRSANFMSVWNAKKDLIWRYIKFEQQHDIKSFQFVQIQLPQNERNSGNRQTSVRTSAKATPFSLVYGMEAVLPIKVEIPSLRSRYDQKRLRATRHGQMYQKRMM
ncbi:putative inactive leucine-rich repeat receptor-like protein kinase [Gossypium australe]|uniref:Putative inactive leucine-rich repeat receptor-like protein kinase n=1 Tax=Gossypium australe TaxID=47621 RepID=A0A5B6VIV3_9ROSI|nr:putative inactive leucine-rich repeat receptor-like protein kinase [Gossypium australe]